jgi:hypothetical protein
VVQAAKAVVGGDLRQGAGFRFGDGHGLARHRVAPHGFFQRRQQKKGLGQGLRRGSGFGYRDHTATAEVERAHQRRPAIGIDVVQEMQARGPRPGAEAAVAQGVKRLGAERGAAGAEHHHVVEARAPVLGNLARRVEVVHAAGQTQERQPAGLRQLAEPVERGRGGHQHAGEGVLAQAALADGRGQAAVGQMVIAHG